MSKKKSIKKHNTTLNQLYQFVRQQSHYTIIGGLLGVALLIGLTMLFGALMLHLNVTTTLADQKVEQVTMSAVDMEHYWQQRDWDGAIALLETQYQNEPESPLIKNWLAHAYLQKALVLRHKGFIEEAQDYLEQVLELVPQQSLAKAEHALASSYLKGVAYYEDGAWAEAIVEFDKIWATDTAYVNVRDLLYSAYYNHGLSQRAFGKQKKARAMFQSASSMRPDLAEPRLQLSQLDFALADETPVELVTNSIEGKYIVVGLDEQRMWVFEDGEMVFDFVVSTGERGRDTAVGKFEILDKIYMAYASTWNLDMPYWMGIYWAGPLENGIHGLPVVRHTGYKLWDGYLGQRVSYGCVILGDDDAPALFNWAEVGVPMEIVPSLYSWTPPQ
ncbi:L,D-transpeptidase family protein [Anaerolineales bacterium HSG6]|nr:L,D-transpeptidase family protein [Anaerolineales bacterium HSG6]MDM8532315.1 L,D-transpeptidase family protein [Anaerolineales bacterium HSG25]